MSIITFLIAVMLSVNQPKWIAVLIVGIMMAARYILFPSFVLTIPFGWEGLLLRDPRPKKEVTNPEPSD